MSLVAEEGINADQFPKVLMDVYESDQALQKQSAGEITRLPLVPAENKNGAIPHVRTREVRPRYKSPLPSSPSASKRCSSPTTTKTPSTSIVSAAARRAVSAERKRPSRPSSPRSPSTPIQDTIAESLLASKKVAGNKLPPESLWPSTMRSLNVSFQSDAYSVPISKKEKPVPDRTLRQSLNVAHRQAEVSRKPTPERKLSPLRGKKNSADQSENFKPVDNLHPRVVDQHRWPTAGKVSTASTRSIDPADKKIKVTSPSLRRLSLDGINSSKSIDLANKTSKTSPSSWRATLDSTTVLTRSTDLGDKTNTKSSSSRLDTGSPSFRRLSLDSTVAPNRSIDIGDKTSKTSSLSSWGTRAPSPSKQSLDGNAAPNRSINLPDKNSKTSLPSQSETGTPPFRRLSLDGGAVMSKSIDLVDKKIRTTSSSNSETDNSTFRRLSLHGNPVSNRSTYLADRTSKTSSSYHPETGKPSPRIQSLEGTSNESGRASVHECLVDDSSAQMARPDSSGSSDGTARRLPSLGLLPVISSVSRWISPSKAKAANTPRGPSPSRIRPSSPTRKLLGSTSVLSFIADIRHAKKNASHIEDVHNLRLLYNRLLQWRYANAQSDDALVAQKIKAEV